MPVVERRQRGRRTAIGATEHAPQHVSGAARANHERLGRDRGDHELHEHVEPVGHGRRRAAGQEGRRARAARPSPGSRPAWRPARRSSPTTSTTPGSTRTSTSSGSTWSATAARPASATRARCRSAISEAIHGGRPGRGRPCSAATATSRAGSTPTSGPITWPLPRWSSPTPWPARWTSTSSNEPLGNDTQGQPVYLKDIWPTQHEIQDSDPEVGPLGDVPQASTARSSRETSTGARCRCPQGDLYEWDDGSTYVKNPPYFDDMRVEPAPVAAITEARVLAVLGDSITTDHISPAGSIKADSPAGRYLIEHGVQRGRLQLLRRAPRATTR